MTRTSVTTASSDSDTRSSALTPRQQDAIRALIRGKLAQYGVKGRWSVRLEDGFVVLESYTHDWIARAPLRQTAAAQSRDD